MRFRRSARSAMACASLLMLALVLLGGPAGASGPADSPWPMYQHDPQHTGRSPYVGPENPAIRWRYEPKWSGLGDPSMGSHDALYVPSSRFVAMDGSAGTVRWVQSDTAKFVSGSVPASGADDTIYVGSSISNELYALGPDGAIQWTFARDDGLDTLVPGRAAQAKSSPSIGSDGTVYFGSTNGRLYAVNSDGTHRWSFVTGARIAGSSPAVGADGTVYVGSWDGNLYAVNPDGTEKWRFVTGDWIGSSPAVGADGTIFVGSHDDRLYAISPQGTEIWSFKLPDDDYTTTTTPAIGVDGTVYVGSHDGNLYAVSAHGTLKWVFPTRGSVSSPPVVDGTGTIYVGSSDRHLYAVNADGTGKWQLNVGDEVTGSMVLGGEGRIFIVTHNPRGKDQVVLIGDGGSSYGIKASASMMALAGVVAVGGLGLYLTRRRTGAR